MSRISAVAGVAGRLLLAGVLLWAGGAKLGDLGASVRAVNAYHLLPYELARVVGSALPFVEVALGLLLLVGLATRVAAAATAGLLAVFVAGIASAWARGLRIDCGCFGGGGELAEGVRPSYGWEIVRDLALLAVAVALAVRPRSPLSVDGWLGGDGWLAGGEADDIDEAADIDQADADDLDEHHVEDRADR
jgi:uncharacterized membrane protein YphA (DoxX/SURF4 family)